LRKDLSGRGISLAIAPGFPRYAVACFNP